MAKFHINHLVEVVSYAFVGCLFLAVPCFARVSNSNMAIIPQEHSEGLSSRLRQRDQELAEAAALMTETRRDLTALRNRTKEMEQVTSDSGIRSRYVASSTQRPSTRREPFCAITLDFSHSFCLTRLSVMFDRSLNVDAILSRCNFYVADPFYHCSLLFHVGPAIVLPHRCV